MCVLCALILSFLAMWSGIGNGSGMDAALGVGIWAISLLIGILEGVRSVKGKRS